jgi:hydrogenase assembly chaperone HypC/HupF
MSLDPETCITCGDVAVPATVVERRDGIAVVEHDGRQEEIAIDLLDGNVAVGDVLLCHAGIALQRVDAE